MEKIKSFVDSGFVKTCGELVTDLQRESEEVIWQEGILRHVPLVGSIYNWISPAQKVNHFFSFCLNYSNALSNQVSFLTGLSINYGNMLVWPHF
jgi:hypothetical protein